MLSSTCKTAIKAVIYLAGACENGKRAGIREIAAQIRASEHTVGKILQILARERLINSAKGPSGGFFISGTQLNQPLIHIVEAIEGKQVFKECGLGLSRCSATHPCPIHDEYKISRDHIEKLFSQKKIIDLCEPVNKGLAHLVG